MQTSRLVNIRAGMLERTDWNASLASKSIIRDEAKASIAPNLMEQTFLLYGPTSPFPPSLPSLPPSPAAKYTLTDKEAILLFGQNSRKISPVHRSRAYHPHPCVSCVAFAPSLALCRRPSDEAYYAVSSSLVMKIDHEDTRNPTI
jgi:hypothetical protein